MIDILGDNKYPSVTIQGILLAANILYLTHEAPNLLIILSIIFILSLFTLQALNSRFFYYFPLNSFAEKETKNIDTYVLYGMTFLAFLFFIWGIAHSFFYAISATIIILLPSYLWRRFMFAKVRNDIAQKLRKKPIVRFGECPTCGGEAIIGKKVFAWNKGYYIVECLSQCAQTYEGYEKINIG